MGSPSSRLNTPEHLRPWLGSGLEFLYAPDRARAVREQQTAPAPQPQYGRQSQQPAPPSNVRQPKPPTQRQAPRQAPQQPRAQQAPVQQNRPAPQPQRKGTTDPNFPEPWATYLLRARPPQSPKVLVTYHELGLDLGGHVDRGRSRVLHNIIPYLAWPKGSSVFWPVAANAGTDLRPDPTMFWNGWQLWKCPYIACFGRDALNVILPDADPGASFFHLDYASIYLLPSLSELVDRLPHEQQLAVEALTRIKI